MSDIAAKNANYLLNIGPDALGRVPERSAQILREVGTWLGTNGEAITSTQPTPFPVNFDWGAVTHRPGKLYFHIFDGKVRDIKVVGLRNRATRASFLDAPDTTFLVQQTPVNTGGNLLETTIKTGPIGDAVPHRVLGLEIEGKADVVPGILQQSDGSIVLESLAAIDTSTGESIAPAIMARGAVARSLDVGVCLSWEFEVLRPGQYVISADCATSRYTDQDGKKIVDTGHEIVINVKGETIPAVIHDDARQAIRGNTHWLCITSGIGTVRFDEPGRYKLTLRVNSVVIGKGGGFILRNLKMRHQGSGVDR